MRGAVMIRSWMAIAGLCVHVLGCSQEENSTVEPVISIATPAERTDPAPVQLDSSMEATLRAADAHDGQADRVISECSECSLAMSGDSEISSQVGDYEIHFCGWGCKARFDADPGAGIESMKQTLGPAESSLSASQEATLRRADAHDGLEDHVISECSECGLAMEGDREFRSEVGDYEIHFCGSGCKERFDADPGAGMEAMQASLESDY